MRYKTRFSRPALCTFPCSTRLAGFLALDGASMLRELGPGEIHEGAYASRSAKIGVGTSIAHVESGNG